MILAANEVKRVGFDGFESDEIHWPIELLPRSITGPMANTYHIGPVPYGCSDVARSDEHVRTGGELNARVRFRRLPSRRVLTMCLKVAAEIDGKSPVLESWPSKIYCSSQQMASVRSVYVRNHSSAELKACAVTLTDSDDV